MMYIKSDMIRQLKGTEVVLQEPMLIKPSLEKLACIYLTEFLTLQVSKEGDFLAGARNSRYFRYFEKREFTQICRCCRQNMVVNSWLGFLALEMLLKAQSRILMKSSSKANSEKGLCNLMYKRALDVLM